MCFERTVSFWITLFVSLGWKVSFYMHLLEWFQWKHGRDGLTVHA